jgi:hypothetical protein
MPGNISMSPGTMSWTRRSRVWLTQPDSSAIACWYRLAKSKTTKPVIDARDQQRHVVARPGDPATDVVLRDRPADDDARAAPEAGEAFVEDLAADVVEEDVDAVRRLLTQLSAQIGALVVDRAVEAELLDKHAAFLGAAGDTDRPGALDPRDLADGRPDTPGSSRDQYGLAVAQPSDV